MASTAIVSSISMSVRPRRAEARAAQQRDPARRIARDEGCSMKCRIIAIGFADAALQQSVLLFEQLLDLPQFADHVGPLLDGIGERGLAGWGAAPTAP